MDGIDWLAEGFEAHRPRLRAVAYRLLGSLGEADDAVQEAWLRLSRADAGEIDNLGGWLTTVVARIALNQLRARGAGQAQALARPLPEPIVDPLDGLDPEHAAVLADSLGLALLVVLDTLSPPERLAFVLHDLFALPFDEIAPIVERSPAATRQLASRARRRVQARDRVPDPDRGAQRVVVEAFLAATREGNFERLLAVLAPDVLLRADLGPAGGRREARGARAVAGQALYYARQGLVTEPVLVNGAVGTVSYLDGRLFSVGALTVSGGRIAEMDILADPERLQAFDLAGPGGRDGG